MNKSDIARARLFNQQIAATNFTQPEEIVRWLGAMQAQDYPMAKWAIGVRLPAVYSILTSFESSLFANQVLP